MYVLTRVEKDYLTLDFLLFEKTNRIRSLFGEPRLHMHKFIRHNFTFQSTSIRTSLFCHIVFQTLRPWAFKALFRIEFERRNGIRKDHKPELFPRGFQLFLRTSNIFQTTSVVLLHLRCAHLYEITVQCMNITVLQKYHPPLKVLNTKCGCY